MYASTQSIPLSRQLLNLLLPPVCACCREQLAPTAPQPALCTGCTQKLPYWDTTSVPVPAYNSKMLDSFQAPFLYEQEIRRLLVRFKYTDNPTLASLLVPFLLPFIEKLAPQHPHFLLMPVPMPRRRLWQRGYNQSAEIAKALAARCDTPLSLYTLQRIRYTSPMAGRSLQQRKTHLQGAFAVRECVRDKQILLLDDIWTTGSTLTACAAELKKQGATGVHALTVAYVAP